MIDGIAADHSVIAFDNRGVGASGGKVPQTVEECQVDDGPEPDEAWALATAVYPGFDSYQGFTDRQIPVAVLERRSAS